MSSTGVDLPKGAEQRSKRGDVTPSLAPSQDGKPAEEQSSTLEKR